MSDIDMGDKATWEYDGHTYTGEVMRPGVFGGGLSYRYVGIWTLMEDTKDGKDTRNKGVIWEMRADDFTISEKTTVQPDIFTHALLESLHTNRKQGDE